MGRPLGQHFLSDPHWIEKILDAAQLAPGERILEIGPGRGAITLPMAMTGARVTAVELDPELAARLRSSMSNLVVVEQDFLQVDLPKLLGHEPGWKVVANLPYYITTPILERLLTRSEGLISDMWLMMQHEVAERIVSPETRLSGSLTHFVRFYSEATYLFRVPPGAFQPPPEVDSTVVHFRFQPPPEDCPPRRFFQILRQAFAQRRKMLRSSLKGLVAPEAFEAAGVAPERRPETLRFEDFVALERASRRS